MTKFKAFALTLAACALAFSLDACGKKQPAAPAQNEASAKTASPSSAAKAPEQAQAQPQPQKKAKPAIVDSEEGSLLARIPSNSSSADKQVKVESDSSNVVVDPEAKAASLGRGEKSFLPISPIPAGSLASKIASTDGLIWRPAWRFKGAGGPWIADLEPSVDESVVAFVETTGKDEGPYGSRIVLWSAHQWKILKIFEIDRKIAQFVFIPDSMEIAAACERQNDLKQPFAFIVVDLEKGALVRSGQPLKDLPKSFVCDNSRLFATFKGERAVFNYSLADLKAAPKKSPSENDGGALALRLASGNLYCAGDAKVECFSISALDRQLDKVSAEALPEGLPVAGNALSAGEGGLLVAPPQTPDSQGDAYLLRSGSSWSLANAASGLLAFDKKSNVAYAGSKARGAIYPWRLPALEALPLAPPESTSPQTPGAPAKLFFLSPANALMILDSKGVFYAMRKAEKDKRWQKIVLFEASSK